MTERYVIVYRDGVCGGCHEDRSLSDIFVSGGLKSPKDGDRPAYRIRIREKPAACAACDMRPTGVMLTSYPPKTEYKCRKCGKVAARSEYLDPEAAYRRFTGRTTFAGAER